MPQLFQVLRCYECLVFQIHQTKKSNKFDCKMCGEKQSIKRHYGLGTSKDCRLHVQKLNGLRGELDQFKEEIESSSDDDCTNTIVQEKEKFSFSKKSKWSEYVAEEDEPPAIVTNETMYIDNKEVVLELPKKKRKKFDTPIKKEKTTEIVKDDFGNTSIYGSSKENLSKSYNSNKYISTIVKDTIDSCYSNFTPAEPITTKKLDLSNTQKEIIENSLLELSKGKEVEKNKKTTSKWAQYVDTEDEGNTSSPGDSQSNVKVLFSLCDDSELDNILDI